MRFRYLYLLLIALMFVVGCTAQNAAVQPTDAVEATPETVAEEIPTDVPAAAPTDEMFIPTDAPTATTAPVSAAASEESGATCPNRGSGLEATDPSTVALASGDVQLLEFFAFW